MEKCKYCNKEFKNVKNHEKHCKLNPDYDKIDHSYLSRNGANTYRYLGKLRALNKQNSIHEHQIICAKCGKEFSVIVSDNNFNKGKYKHFCSRSCANSHAVSDLTKEKISKGVIHKIYGSKEKQETYKLKNCACCGKQYRPTSLSKFCSIECKKISMQNKCISDETRQKLSEAGKHSAAIQSESRRSKNEIYFCELCEKHFENVEHNLQLFNGWDADVIIHDIKYAILWNGPWHYKKLNKNHSVEQVQNRDNIKIKEIIKYGYTPYIIKDLGKYNETFVQMKFNEFLEFLNTSN